MKWIAVVIGALLLAALGVMGWQQFGHWKKQEMPFTTSDARPAEEVRGQGDSYGGYLPVASSEMVRLGFDRNMSLVWDASSDGGNPATRLALLADKKRHWIVIPGSSFLENGYKNDYSDGVAVLALCDSRGADAIVGWEDRFPTGSIDELNNSGLKGAFVPNGPNSFLLDLTIDNGHLDRLRSSKGWMVPCKDMAEVISKLEGHEVDFATLYEPELSQTLARNPGLKQITSSDDSRGYTVDLLVVSRQWLADNREQVKEFLRLYFEVLEGFLQDPEKLTGEFERAFGVDRALAQQMIEKIWWYDLYENATDFFNATPGASAPGRDGMWQLLDDCRAKLVKAGKLPQGELRRDLRLLMKRDLVTELFNENQNLTRRPQPKIHFDHLSPDDWARLKPVQHLLKDATISFQAGKSDLTEESAAEVDKIGQLIRDHHPTLRILIKGHVATEAARGKSQERAEAVKQRLVEKFQLDDTRILALGIGPDELPLRMDGESELAYTRRKSRVEIVLFERNKFIR